MEKLSDYEINKLKAIECEYDKALYLVSCLFRNIKDKEGEPYINHLLRVSIGVKEKDTKVAALLHDAVEDIEFMTFDYLKELGFNDNIISLVKLVTKDRDNKKSYHDEISNILSSNNIEAIKLKLSDMSDNYNSERLRKLDEDTRIRLENKYKNEIIRLKEYLEKGEKKMREIKVNGIYKHFKGTTYKVLAIAKHTETLEDLVIYTHDDKIWARPYDMFAGEVDHEKYPGVKQKYRFEEITIDSVKK